MINRQSKSPNPSALKWGLVLFLSPMSLVILGLFTDLRQVFMAIADGAQSLGLPLDFDGVIGVVLMGLLMISLIGMVLMMFGPKLDNGQRPVESYWRSDLPPRYQRADMLVVPELGVTSFTKPVRDINNQTVAEVSKGGLHSTILQIADQKYSLQYTSRQRSQNRYPVRAGTIFCQGMGDRNSQQHLADFVLSYRREERMRLTFIDGPELRLLPTKQGLFPSSFDVLINDQVVGKAWIEGAVVKTGIVLVLPKQQFNLTVRACLIALLDSMG